MSQQITHNFEVVLSDLAQQDLSDILQYTLQTWGENKMDAYADKLEQGIHLLANHPAIGRIRDDLFDGCRLHLIGSHLVFYEIGEHEIRIARILHERVDVGGYL
ncbi:type II toxin-antitoxin system RelE/ParE family toxin [Undibacterium sp. Ji50W]|uniref:type II toxin-antitoxin system RelE/ParE family toxin n=1 Tax=Undibacterium sp. Ji50W TaxID=3413041 RepID=UPI003BF39E5A